MATTRQYFNALRTTRNAFALKMGVDVTQSTKEVRAVAGGTLACLAVILKLLVDKGLVSDAELQAAQTAALGADGSTWDDEPLQPPATP